MFKAAKKAEFYGIAIYVADIPLDRRISYRRTKGKHSRTIKVVRIREQFIHIPQQNALFVSHKRYAELRRMYDLQPSNPFLAGAGEAIKPSSSMPHSIPGQQIIFGQEALSSKDYRREVQEPIEFRCNDFPILAAKTTRTAT